MEDKNVTTVHQGASVDEFMKELETEDENVTTVHQRASMEEIIDALEYFVYPDDLDVVISRANAVKKRLLEDNIKEGDMVIISPTKSPSLHKISGGQRLEVLDIDSDGLLLVNVVGNEGRFTREKVLLVKGEEK